MSFFGRIVKSIPPPLRRPLRRVYGLVPLAVRHGSTYRAMARFLARSQWWSEDRLEAYRRDRLRDLIAHAYRHVPYYRDLFDGHGIRPEHIRSRDDLKIVPHLTKEIIRGNVDRLIDRSLPPSRVLHLETGGTTGLPMPVTHRAGETGAIEWAFVWRDWQWAGFRPGDRRVILRGDLIERSRKGTRACWMHNPVERALVFTSFCMRDEHLRTYAEQLRRFRPRAIQAYPSSLYLMTLFFRNHGISPVPLTCILTSSENLYAHQRKEIEAYWGVPVFDLYGNAERSVMAAQCEHGSYHVIGEYGIAELESEVGEAIRDGDRLGEVVSTGFINRAMPLIRYRTGDLAMYREGACSCGRAYPRLHGIQGRTQDFFVDRNGTVVRSMFSDEPIQPCADRLFAYQYLQEVPGELRLTLDLKPGTEVTAEERGEIIRSFHSYFPDFTLDVAIVDNIPRTSSGKFRYVIQKLALDELSAG